MTVLAAAAFGIPLLGEAVSLLDEARKRWKRGTTSAEQDLGRSVDVIAEALQNEFRERDAETLAAARVEVLQLLETCPPDLRQLAAGNFDAERAAAELIEKASWDEQTRTEIEPTVRRILVIVLENFPKHPQRIPEALLAGIVELLRRSEELPGELRRELEKLQDALAPSAILSRDPALAGFGLDVAPAGFRNAAKAFLREYLGTPEEPVPFGGRGAVLDRMWEWLDDARAPSRGLLVAPAGRGKSALVARFVADLARARTEGLVFLPVSIRFGSNAEADFWQALAAAVSKRLGEDLAVPRADPVAHYRGFAIDRVSALTESGKPAILVIDGLDEAAGWGLPPNLLPPDLPARFRILVAARVQAGDRDDTDGWQQRLGWERAEVQRFDLPPLDAQGIGEVLRSMGDPLAGLATDVDIPQELLRLTEGEPLLIRWYVEDLQARGEEAARLRPEQLREIEPGYRGYFRRWFAEEERRRCKDPQSLNRDMLDQILVSLAVANGPLLSADLAELLRVLRHDPGFLLPNDALAPLARFVLGDGRALGYVLQHPKLGEYLRAEHFEDPAFIREARRAFVEWMRKTVHALNAGELRPEECPRYLLLHGSLHLEEEDAPLEDFAALVENGWRLAHETVEGGPHGLARDVEAVFARAEREPLESTLGLRIRCALVLSSIRSLGRNIPVELLVEAVRAGVMSFDAAAHHARHLDASDARALALIELAALAHPSLRRTIAEEAFAVARQIGDVGLRARVLIALAPHLPESRRQEVVEEALAAAREIWDEEERARVLAALAPHLPESRRQEVVEEALAAAREIWDEEERARVLAALASHLPRAVLNAAEKIWDEWLRADVLVALAPHLPRAVLNAAEKIWDERRRADVLVTLAPHLPEAVLAAAREIRGEEERADVLVALAPRLPKTLVANARRIGGKWRRADVLVALAPHLPDAVLAASQRIGSERLRARVLAALAPHLPEAVLAASQRIGSERLRARVLAALAPHLPEARWQEALEEALATAREIGDEEERADVLVVLAPHLPEARRQQVLEEALAAAREIGDKEGRARVLATLAPHLPEAQRQEVVEEALAAARRIGSERLRARVLAKLAPHLPEAVLTATREIGDEEERADVLAKLAPHLPEAVLTAVREIEDMGLRARVLVALAPHLPGAVLAAVREIGEEWPRSVVLEAVALHPTIRQPAEVLAELARLGASTFARREFLEALRETIPAVVAMGKKEAARETLRALQDVGAWYP
ncbi:MAG TPA: hypothetical protein ENJ38_01140 [Rhodospirillales bacterium]|nr:hypothetical protein [Rhodospirillales bacterium]